jgi:curli biogenesis system outer membrane secretion channel CsgG
VERKKLDALVQEQAFQSSGHVDPQTAVGIGKMLGAEVIVMGTISKLGLGQNTVRVADSTITRYNAVAEVSLRAVNVQTGAVVFSGSEGASSQAKSASVPDFDMGNKSPSVDGPLKKAIQTLSQKLVQKIKPAPGPKSKISIL